MLNDSMGIFDGSESVLRQVLDNDLSLSRAGLLR